MTKSKKVVPFRYQRWECCHGSETEYVRKYGKEGFRLYQEDLAVLLTTNAMANNGATFEGAKRVITSLLGVGHPGLTELFDEVEFLYETGWFNRKSQEYDRTPEGK